MTTKAWSLALLTVALAGSAVSQNRYLEKPLPQGWGSTADTLFANQPLPADDEWWREFNDPLLDSLITEATTRNFTVLSAIDRMEAARSQLRMERSNFFPTLGLSAGWNRNQSSGNTTGQAQTWTSYYDATLDTSWELDLFGTIRQRVKAQRELFHAGREEVASVQLSLCAQVASTYISLRETQQELAVVNHNCDTQAAVLAITETRYQTGLVSKLDVAQARSVYYSTRASIPSLESEISQYINSLAILLGTYPQQLRDVLSPIGTLPDYMKPVTIGVPADLLLRRPDVRQAELQVEAQAALLGASKRDWLPQMFLKGSFGYAAHDLKEISDHRSMTFQIAPALTWTLFSGGKLVNATRLARNQLDEAIHSFNQTVLTAVQEADNALTSYRNSIKQIVLMREVCNQGEETLSLSLDLYKQGLAPFQNVLDALRSLLTYENQLTQAQGYSLLQLISLYKALGGGW